MSRKSRTTVIFDNAILGQSLCFADPIRIIQADESGQIQPAISELQAALHQGCYLAGFFSYEFGYVQEDRLARLIPKGIKLPFLWFAVFSGQPKIVRGDSLWGADKAYIDPVQWEWSEADYAQRFERVAEWIRAGDIYQANLSMRGRFRFIGEPRALYRELRKQGLSAHGAFIETEAFQILSTSPELFFDLAADGTITTRPMKGTKERRHDSLDDATARAALAASEKDRAENLMIVDLLRNDLTRISEIPSVSTSGLFEIETYPTVHQMVSTVTAKLPRGLPVERILQALFPSGSITGAPKIRAMEIIAEMESSPRGIYCGAIGFFAPDGSARFNVAIRTLTLIGKYGEVGIGSAVVADSSMSDEYAECLLKARYLDAVFQTKNPRKSAGF